MADTTLPGVLLEGDHASRPAATAVATGSLYACSTHGLIYQSDGSAWSTWATLGGGAVAAEDVSVLDTAANFTGTDVEAVLAELQDNIDGVSGGDAWTLVIDEDGSSAANFTSVGGGTWASTGGVLRQSATGASNRYFMHSTRVPHVLLAECEVMFTSGISGTTNAGNGLGFRGPIDDAATTTNILAAYLSRNATAASSQVRADRIGVVNMLNTTVTLNADQWYTLRELITLNSYTVWVDGVLTQGGFVNTNNETTNLRRFALHTYDQCGDFRNIKVWTPTFPA
jgi:hypothetical protein